MKRLFLFVASFLLISSHAQAYTNMCESDNNFTSSICEWRDYQTDFFYISNVSFPSGSVRYGDLTDSFDAWENVVGAPIDVRYILTSNSDGQFTIGDTISEVGFISAEDMGYNEDGIIPAGLAHLSYFWNTSEGFYINEVDILFNIDDAASLSSYYAEIGYEYYGLPDYLTRRSYPSPSTRIPGNDDDISQSWFRPIILHEIGHALGLGHTTDYGAMLNRGGGEVHPGSNPFIPLPDDREGLRAYYPGSSTETDMGLSNFTEDNVGLIEIENGESGRIRAITNAHDALAFCPGDTFEVTKTTLNNGTSTTTVDAKYYLSTDDIITTSDVLIESSSITVDAEADYTNTVTLTVPSVVGTPDGQTYAIGLIIDPDNTVSETRGSNNTMLLAAIFVDDYLDCLASSTRPSMPASTTYYQLVRSAQKDFTTKLKNVSGVYEIKVTAITPKRAPDGKAIYSYIDTSVQKTFFGSTSSTGTLQIRQIGGSIGNEQEGEGLIDSEAPQLAVGDHLIIFLGKNGRSAIPFVGGETGVLKIVKDPTYGDIVTTYQGLPFVGYDSRAHLFSIRPDYLKEDLDQQNTNEEVDKNGESIVVQRDLSLLQTPPMSQQEFAEALSQLIQTTGPYAPITYEKKEPTSIFNEAIDFSKINAKDQKAKDGMQNLTLPQEEDRAF